MQLVKGIQHTPPRSNSSGYTNRDWSINCSEFVVNAQTIGELVDIKVFFPSPSKSQEGIGLSFCSPGTAVAVARALLTVAEGCVSEIRGHFGE